jgi:hypothetical protein
MASYPHVFHPQAANEDEEPKFSCCFVFDPGTNLKTLKEAAVVAAVDKWGDKAAGMIKAGKLRMPFRTDVEEKGYEAGSVFFNARSKNPPGVVSIYPDPNTGKPTPITDEDEIYPGCRVKASVAFFPYDVKGNKGVGVALNNLQKVGDGPRLDSKVKAEDEFAADPTAVADLSDMEDPVPDSEGGDDLSDLL